jgi:hypothetical protein
MTTLACAGGTQALIRAHDLVTAYPGATILVVAAEVVSAVYHHHDTSIEAMIYKALFGDSAGAALVTGEPLGPAFAIEDTFEYVLPASLDRYTGRLDHTGLHFDSTTQALTAVNDVLPALTTWIGDRQADFAVIHPGSPASSPTPQPHCAWATTTPATPPTPSPTSATSAAYQSCESWNAPSPHHRPPATTASQSPTDPASPPSHCPAIGTTRCSGMPDWSTGRRDMR